jgi:hypothetical protein
LLTGWNDCRDCGRQARSADRKLNAASWDSVKGSSDPSRAVTATAAAAPTPPAEDVGTDRVRSLMMKDDKRYVPFDGK